MEKIKHEKHIMKIICVSLAVILWFYVSYFENPTMSKTVRDVSLEINNEQLEKLRSKRLAIYSISEEDVDVKITARRLSLANMSSKTLSAYVNINSINKSGTYYIPASIKSDESSGASFYVKGRDIKIVVEPIVSGTFNIDADINSNYIAYDSFKLGTEKVVISAPESVFKEIASVKTEHINIDREIHSKTKSLLIYNKDGEVIDRDDVICSPDKIEINFTYLDDKTVPVRLVKDNGKTVDIDDCKVKIYGDKETLDSISYIPTVSVDIEKHEHNSTTKIKLDIPAEVKTTQKEVEIKLLSDYFDIVDVPESPDTPEDFEILESNEEN